MSIPSTSTSRPFPTIPSFLVSTILTFVPTIMAGGSTAPSSIPQVDYGKMGTVGLGGSFSGLDWYSSDSPFASSSSSSSSTFSTTGDTLFYKTEDGILRALGSTNEGGIINSLCWSSSPDSSSGNGTLFIGGTFTSLSGVSANNVGSFSLSTNTFSALASGLSGNVNTLYCDDDNSEIWFGGSFNAPTGQGGNVALWSTSSSSWTAPSFGGLNGVVQSITPSTDKKSLYFGGDFTTTYLSSSSSNSTSRNNITSQPNAPVNTTTVGQSGYLTPLTISASAGESASYQIHAGPSSSLNQDGQNYGDTNGLLCPGTSTWLAQENTISNVNLVGNEYLPATGVRMVNGHEDGRSTTYFCFTSLPDYQELNMTYTDPKTGKNETCTDHCPLYTDPTISAQDFIFTQGTHNLTGFEIQLKQWTGDGAALGSVSLLTDGAYSSATGAGASSTCSSDKNSTVQSVGDWSTKTAATTSATELYLSSSVSTRDPTEAQVTFYPYVGSAGQYDIYVFIPGCLNIGDCDGRTSVDIEVFPLQGGLGWTSTISEQVDYDTKTLVYSGPVDATSDAFTPTLSLALAANPAAPARGNNYVVVADRIQLVLTGITESGSTISTTSSSSNGTNVIGTPITNTTTNSTYNVAYGVYEYARSTNSSLNAATSSLTNDTETALTRLGFGLDAALNASGSAASSWVVNTIVAANNTVFVGGDFSASNNYTNVISIDTASGQASALASQGLSGVVNTAAVVGGYVFFGGDFTSTASSGGVALNYIARYDPSSKAWAALGGGLDGFVTDLLASTASPNELIVMGNFSHIVSANGTSSGSGGYAVYDISTSEWLNTGIVFGNVSAGAVPSSSFGISSESFFAGKVYGHAGNSVGGVATLSTDDNGDAVISSLNDVNFGTSGSSPSSSTSTSSRRRSLNHPYTRSWLARYTDAIVERAHNVLSSRATPPTIPSQSSQAPAVLSGAFWTNSSASGKPTITILGGNFTSSSNNIQGLAFYNEKDGGLTGPSTPVEGVVKTLNVIGNNVYMGGEALNVQNVGSGLMVYDLKAGNWVTGGMASLNPSSGSDNVTVNAIKTRGNTNTVVVAGNFGTAGSLGCAAVCLWDSKDAQWSTPGSGLSGGEVRAVDFAGDSSDTLIVAGSFALSSGHVAYVASYSFSNSSWTPLGTLPGPALAIAVDDKNSSNIFAAGYSTSDGSTYLQQWNGATWTAQSESNPLAPGSLVSQLAFVPMKSEHEPQGSIESDRMLMVSGDLYLQNSGNVTSALYDGSTFYPYLVGTSSNGGLGAGSALFWSESDFSFKVRHYLARGLVVLVAIAIATGLILLLVLLVLLLTFCFRRRERKDQTMYNEKEVDSDGDIDSTHQNVFNNVQAALEASLIGGGLAGAGAAASTNRKENRVSDPSSYNSGAYPVGSEGGDQDEELEEEGRETTMRYDFDGPELQEGELAMKAGQRVVVLDDEQSMEWWFARDPLTGREGVVPATYGGLFFLLLFISW
ncbi:hypothetical protein I302_106656 [Kwoniella bestiolae CBS 10118]|uniref:SH3 domain-containing protein n=1 Tax=Kwoniella bestiolae CBS 10118 TaxID=1296100 RepID=A0A1B9G0S6_9TREE|nr:hypothetical protein I302_06082 [Kwoniella bestiolae CBS 10118]OCF24621.1 hypothetical protein I302_06082 [Kwoniella bestiolae CBS 10118]